MNFPQISKILEANRFPAEKANKFDKLCKGLLSKLESHKSAPEAKKFQEEVKTLLVQWGVNLTAASKAKDYTAAIKLLAFFKVRAE